MPCSNGNGSTGSTARPGCERCGCNEPTRVTPRAGVTHIIRLICIHDTAQGDEHDHPPSTEGKPFGRETKTAEEKFERERVAAVNRASGVDTSGAALIGLFAPLLDYDMDALKSAGRAIIRSPSIAKQSWGAGRHKSEYPVLRTSYCEPRLTWLNRASADKQLTWQPAPLSDSPVTVLSCGVRCVMDRAKTKASGGRENER